MSGYKSERLQTAIELYNVLSCIIYYNNLVPYSMKTAMKNKKTGSVFEIVELHLYPRHLSPEGVSSLDIPIHHLSMLAGALK